MYIFHYDPATLAYQGGTPCDFSPLEPGVILVPAWASKTPPGAWDAAKEHPFYVPALDSWERRPIEQGGAHGR